MSNQDPRDYEDQRSGPHSGGALLRPGANGGAEVLRRTSFDGQEDLATSRETQTAALAARATAEVQARYIIALKRPRDYDTFRTRLLRDTKRLGFAMEAEYSRPVGGGKSATGPTIRFVEAALRHFGNCDSSVKVVYEDDDKQQLEVSVIDYETNYSQSDSMIVEKFVESRNPRDGDEVIGQRVNSTGQITYKIRANEDRLRAKVGAEKSRRIRTVGLRILPRDIVQEALNECRKTRKDNVDKDPDAARRAISDAFAEISIMPHDIGDYLGHPLAQASPAQIDEMRTVFMTIREGQANWRELVEAKKLERGEIEEDQVSPAAKAAKAKLEANQAARQAKAQSASAATGPQGAKTETKPPAASNDSKRKSDKAQPGQLFDPNAPMSDAEKREIEETERKNR